MVDVWPNGEVLDLSDSCRQVEVFRLADSPFHPAWLWYGTRSLVGRRACSLPQGAEVGEDGEYSAVVVG